MSKNIQSIVTLMALCLGTAVPLVAQADWTGDCTKLEVVQKDFCKDLKAYDDWLNKFQPPQPVFRKDPVTISPSDTGDSGGSTSSSTSSLMGAPASQSVGSAVSAPNWGTTSPGSDSNSSNSSGSSTSGWGSSNPSEGGTPTE